MRPPTLGLRYKFAAVAVALVGIVACALTVDFSARHSAATESGLESRTLGYALFVAHEAASEDDAHVVFEAARLDPDVRSVLLVRADGAVLGRYGLDTIPLRPVTEAVSIRGAHRIGAFAPVVLPDGERGTVAVELSTESIELVQAKNRRSAAFTGLLVLAAGLLFSWLAGGSFARRISRIQQATRAVARGRLDEPPIADDSPDEIGRLARDFNTMSTRIRDLVEVIMSDGLEEMARLDGIVVARTAELRQKNEDLAFLLDHVDQGFMTVTRDGSILTERSAILQRWFGAVAPDAKLWSYVHAGDRDAADWLAVSWEALFDGVLPLELVLDQLPREIRSGDATFGIRYQPVQNGDTFDKVIVVISDISGEIARRRAEATQKELAQAFGHFVEDPALIEEFMDEGSALVDSIRKASGTNATLAQQKRWVHTLKGNASFVGLTRLALLCHEIETQIDETGDAPSAKSRLALGALWGEFVGTFAPFVRRRQDFIDIERTALATHIEALRAGRSRADLEREVKTWFYEPTRQRLDRAAEHARRIAKLLEKPEPEIIVEDNHVRVDAQAWGPFWGAFVHVVRNAVDHGVEEAAVRAESGKSLRGRITLRALQTAAFDIVEIEDDGAGIDWAALRRRATLAGWPAEASPTDLLFADGLSTKDTVTETSGRGIGLAACRAVCDRMGARIEVTSTRHVGTKLSFRVPRCASDDLVSGAAA